MNSVGADILFSAAKSRLELILELVGEFNDISGDLRALGYGASDEEIQRGKCEEPSVPYLSLSANQRGWFVVQDADILDKFYLHGPIQRKKTSNVKQIRAPLVRVRNELGDACAWTCFYCRKSGCEASGPDARTWHVDHVYPIANGGDNQLDNLVLSCATCNLAKKQQTANEYFLALKGRMVTVGLEKLSA